MAEAEAPFAEIVEEEEEEAADAGEEATEADAGDEAVEAEEEAGEEEAEGEGEEEDAGVDEEAMGAPPGGGPISMALGEGPDLGEVAEIVVISTSLGSIKRQFFSSKRVQHFLDCKGVVYFLIDCNRDLSSAMSKAALVRC